MGLKTEKNHPFAGIAKIGTPKLSVYFSDNELKIQDVLDQFSFPQRQCKISIFNISYSWF